MYSGTFVIRNQPHLPTRREDSLAADADERDLLLSPQSGTLNALSLVRLASVPPPKQQHAYTKSLEGMRGQIAVTVEATLVS